MSDHRVGRIAFGPGGPPGAARAACLHCERLRGEVATLSGHLSYLRAAIAEVVGYTLTGNADEDDAQLIDRLNARGGPQ